jgi:hypothetical protein
MKATLLKSLSFLLFVSFMLDLTARPAGAHSPHGQNESPQTNASEDSKIKIENWAKPEPGWLYVLVPKPDSGPGKTGLARRS